MAYFDDHLKATGKSYFQHLRGAFCIGNGCLFASLAAYIHGIFPFLFTKTASEKVREIHEDISG